MRQPEIATSCQYLSFFLGDAEYALGILQVREIIEYDTVTRIPGTPAWIGGAFNLRGGILPIIDLGMKLGLSPCTITRRTCVVIAEIDYQGERIVLGLLVDTIGQVLDLGPGDIEATPGFGTPIHCDYLIGLGRVGKKFVLLLDANKILDHREIAMADDLQRNESKVEAVEQPSAEHENSLMQSAPDGPNL
jgi:purine-binding chemotaxis protein CheW